MTAALVRVTGHDDMVTCLNCGGAGERNTRTVDRWGVAVLRDCETCQGTGLIPGEVVMVCHDGCSEPYWPDDGCPHLQHLCGECRTRCSDCVDDARHGAESDAAREAYFDGPWS